MKLQMQGAGHFSFLAAETQEWLDVVDVPFSHNSHKHDDRSLIRQPTFVASVQKFIFQENDSLTASQVTKFLLSGVDRTGQFTHFILGRWLPAHLYLYLLSFFE